ncbi:MAG TPA: PBP1A family penicillin-binding protein, partial [Bryobacteraceae bacterium]|nr:PBP1A family penicillin-binding protein [Bryobacteraceae bacterium]
MPVKLRKSLFLRFLRNPWGRAFLITFTVLLLTGASVFTYFYVQYSKIIEQKLEAGPFSNTSLLYAAPEPVMLGEKAQADELAGELRRSGYSESNSSRVGWYKVRPDGIEINPGPDAYEQEGAVLKIKSGKISEIISLRDHTDRTEYMLEPELITNLFDKKREKRRIVHFDDIPKVMVNAVLSAEDKHFFQHAGFDPIGILRAALIDIKDRRNSQGASTLTQQLARTLWLGTQRGWRRKIPETLITIHLEQELTKQQIFEYYANAIYLGNQGSFSINGFGEGAEVYFGKDLRQITLPEAALLAGLIQNPGLRNPFRYPERAKARRNMVLKNMRENGYIGEQQYEEAAASPVTVVRGTMETNDAPYFVDLVRDTLENKFPDLDFQDNSYRVYTSLDMDLQRDAYLAVMNGIQETDQQWKRRSRKYGTADFPVAQVCLIALDAETGAIKAFVAGRSYGASQLDHCLAKRQPGSSFKPFVYTAAMETALDNNGNVPVLTPASTVVDEPTTFYFDGDKVYQPADFEDKYSGTVTLREALAHSMNVPAVKVAEMVGYDKVADVARQVGLNIDIKPTPSIALGAYEVMPLEIAGAYTVFPNSGELLQTSFINAIRNQHDATIFQSQPQRKPAIDPRVAYLVENMMEEVLQTGTGASVRARGFTLPAAGKTGTSRDGWFAGFTSKIICVVWVGFDDNRDFKLEGAHSALPIWVDF